MTPKEKAEELVNWFLDEGLHSFGRYQCTEIEDLEGSKFCATKVVDEMIKVLNPEHWGIEMNIAIDELNYWREVKKEIESL